MGREKKKKKKKKKILDGRKNNEKCFFWDFKKKKKSKKIKFKKHVKCILKKSFHNLKKKNKIFSYLVDPASDICLFKRLSHANLKKGKNFFFSSCRLLCKNAEMKLEKNRNRDRIFPELDGDNKVKNLDKTKIDEEKFSLTELGRIKTILKPWRSLISTRSFFGPGGQEF